MSASYVGGISDGDAVPGCVMDPLFLAHGGEENMIRTMTVSEAAEELGVSPPTVRSWIVRGLLDVAESSPQGVASASVQQLKEDLGRLRVLAKDERRFSQLLEAADDQRALEQPGAREGLEDALTGNSVELRADI
jgi:transposase-like protein